MCLSAPLVTVQNKIIVSVSKKDYSFHVASYAMSLCNFTLQLLNLLRKFQYSHNVTVYIFRFTIVLVPYHSQEIIVLPVFRFLIKNFLITTTWKFRVVLRIDLAIKQANIHWIRCIITMSWYPVTFEVNYFCLFKSSILVDIIPL